MKRVLVTGGLGFIGSNLASKLLSLGHSVTVVDDLSSSRKDSESFKNAHAAIEFIETCFASDTVIERVTSKEFDVIFHIAAIPRVSYSVEHPYETTDVNVNRTTRLVEASIGNIDRFIFSSSSSVYGGTAPLPTPVDCSKNPKSPYAWQKGCIEDFLDVICSLYPTFDAVCLRYFNVFGPGQFGDSAYSTAIAAWCHAIKNGKPLRKDGTGEQSRDMCYIDNVIEANLCAMRHVERFVGEKFNVACGDSVSNNEILEFFMQRFGDIPIDFQPFRSGDVMHTRADISVSIKILGYKPTVRFWDGMEKTLNWWNLKGMT